MFRSENQYEIRKKYCPSRQKNVIIRVYFGECAHEECTEFSRCQANGGCTNGYLQSVDKASHSS
ncbi:MAG: hypothetical protein J6B86_03490 [Clostridia bacterium]|nr:hypothetical protein [Clostridia bacterium]